MKSNNIRQVSINKFKRLLRDRSSTLVDASLFYEIGDTCGNDWLYYYYQCIDSSTSVFLPPADIAVKLGDFVYRLELIKDGYGDDVGIRCMRHKIKGVVNKYNVY